MLWVAGVGTVVSTGRKRANPPPTKKKTLVVIQALFSILDVLKAKAEIFAPAAQGKHHTTPEMTVSPAPCCAFCYWKTIQHCVEKIKLFQWNFTRGMNLYSRLRNPPTSLLCHSSHTHRSEIQAQVSPAPPLCASARLMALISVDPRLQPALFTRQRCSRFIDFKWEWLIKEY